MKLIKSVALCLAFGLLTGCGAYNRMVDRIQARIETEMESRGLTEDRSYSMDEGAYGDDYASGYEDYEYDAEYDNSYVKFNAYVDLANLISGRYSDVLERYERYYGLDDTMRTDDPGSMLSIGKYNIEMVEGLSAIIDFAPDMPGLDEAVAPIVAPLLDVLNLLDNEMYGYYEMKNYVDDDFAKGREYHQRLVTQLDYLNPLMEVFLDEIETQAENMRTESLQQYEDAGLMIQYYTLRTIQSGKELSAYLYAAGLDSDTVHTANLDEFKPYYDALTEDASGFFEWSKNPDQVALEPDFAGHHWFSMLEDDMGELKVCATEMYELIRDSKQVNIVGDGSPEEFSNELSDLIDRYNEIISY